MRHHDHSLHSVFLFEDRTDAGVTLASDLERFATHDAVVVGITRGGVVVAAAVAQTLGLPLDAVGVCRDRQLHSDRPTVPLADRVALLVDDGLATDATMRAAARWARGRGAVRIVAAAPVGARAAVSALADAVDRVVCPHVVADLLAVGLWYARFDPVEEAEVTELLASPSGLLAAR
jgi:putative phosphoribosyl transferase